MDNCKVRFMKGIYWTPLVFLLLISCDPLVDTLKAEGGFIDLSDWSLSRPVELEGEWEFYWDTLLDPANFAGDGAPEPQYVLVPHMWGNYEIEGKKLPETGN